MLDAYRRELDALLRRVALPPSDPRVARLLEGAAFLLSRGRSDLEDELSELTLPILADAQRPLPPLAVLEMTPSPELRRSVALQAADVVTLRSPAGETASWSIRTALTLHPFVVDRVRVERRGPREQLLRISLRSVTGNPLAAPPMFRFFVSVPDPQAAAELVWAATSASPSSFGAASAWLDDSHPSSALLRQHFTLPESFHWFDVPNSATGGPVDRVELEVPLRVPLGWLAELSATHLRTNCVGVAGVWNETVEADTIAHDLPLTRHRIVRIDEFRSGAGPIPPWPAPRSTLSYRLEPVLDAATGSRSERVRFVSDEGLDGPAPVGSFRVQLQVTHAGPLTATAPADWQGTLHGSSVRNLTRVFPGCVPASDANLAFRLNAYLRMPLQELVRRESLEAFLSLHDPGPARAGGLVEQTRFGSSHHVDGAGQIRWVDEVEVTLADVGRGVAFRLAHLLELAFVERTDLTRLVRTTVHVAGVAEPLHVGALLPGQRRPSPF